MAPDKQIDEFVQRLRTASGPNLLSVVLYGSAAAGDFVPEYSDVNLLCVLRETSYAAIEALAPAIKWWGKKNHRVPLLMSAEEMRRSADVFSIEFLDMRANHRLLWGEDLLKTLEIPMRLHRAQLEYELREKTILLRQHLLILGSNEAGKWDLLLRSLSTFGTLFRHALIALGDEPVSGTKRESAFALAAKLGIKADVFRELLDIREKKSERKSAKLNDLFARYLQLVEEVTKSVDKMLDSAA